MKKNILLFILTLTLPSWTELSRDKDINLIKDIKAVSRHLSKINYDMRSDKINGQPNLPFIPKSLFEVIYEREMTVYDSVYIFGHYEFQKGLGYVLYFNSAECDHEADWFTYTFIDFQGKLSDEVTLAILDDHITHYEVVSEITDSLLISRKSESSEWVVGLIDQPDTLFIEEQKLIINKLVFDTIDTKTWTEDF